MESTYKINQYEEKKTMNKLMRNGIIAASTAATVGMVFGMTEAIVYAEETDASASEVFVQEMPMAGSVAEAQTAVEEAQVNVANTEAAVTEAQINTETAQQEVQAATDAVDTARADAEGAFEAAKTEAAEADTAAQANVDTAQMAYDEADAVYQPAAEEAAAAAEALGTAESDLQKAQEDSFYTTEEDVTQKESELTEAENALAAAEIEASEAETARDEATADAELKENARAQAETAMTEAGAEKADSDAKAEAAATDADKATKDLERAEGLKDGTLDITETDEYKEVQYREAELDKAADKYWQTKEDMENAARDLSYAESGIKSATDNLERIKGSSLTGEDLQKALDETGQFLQGALAAKEGAEKLLEQLNTLFPDIEIAFFDAITQNEGAHMLLDNLTSEETIARLRGLKQAADEVLQAALADKAVKDAAWEQADSAFKTASAEESQAKLHLEETAERFAKAVLTRDMAKDTVTSTSEELEVLRERYAPVLAATIARDAAAAEVSRTDAVMQDAKAVLDQAEADLEEALRAKEITADKLLRATGLTVEEALQKDIEDEDFLYLNEYIVEIRNREADLATAEERLEAAKAELAACETDNNNAQLAYAAAVADLALAQEQEAQDETEEETDPAEEENSDAEDVPAPVKPEETIVETAPAEPGCDGEVQPECILDTDTEGMLLAAAANPVGPLLTAAEPAGRTFAIDPVATGDETETMGLLAGLLASVGVMAAVFKKRLEER